MKTVCIALFAGIAGCAFVQAASAAGAAKFKEEVVWSFGSGTDGQDPSAGLINVKGTFYGTTGGGIYGGGTVFSLDPRSDTEKVLYYFCGQNNCADGEDPFASLIDVKDTLYGTTVFGGVDNGGTVFALERSTGDETVLHSFGNGADGAYPLAGLIDVKSMQYGTTLGGGTNALGTAFALDPKTGAEMVLYSFCSRQNCADGQNPNPALIALSGTLDGTTSYGGASGNGTAFAIDASTGAEKVLHSFGNGTDGQVPLASLINVKGTLYGTTQAGGAAGHGTVFSLDPSTGAEKVLYSFLGGSDGGSPLASLVNIKDMLYGTTKEGGDSGRGTAFSLDPSTEAETVLHSFGNGTDGEYPEANLIMVSGKLYGTTGMGGAYGYGTVFVLEKTR